MTDTYEELKERDHANDTERVAKERHDRVKLGDEDGHQNGEECHHRALDDRESLMEGPPALGLV